MGETELEVFANPRILREQTYRNNLIDLGVAFEVKEITPRRCWM
ncbi:hypothetical protein [Algoriphagus boritolerans]